MSTATATPRASRPSQRGLSTTGRPVSRPPVRVVQTPAVRPARAPFVVLVLVLLSLGLGALLLLNTLLAQGSFTLHELDAKVADLADEEQALQQKVAVLASPRRLARSASQLGMVASVNPAFLRAEDGKVLGAPVPAASPPPVVGSDTGTSTEQSADPGTTSSTAEPNAESDVDPATGQANERQQPSQDDQSQQAPPGGQTGNDDAGNGGADR